MKAWCVSIKDDEDMTASQANSQRLYELSGWDDTEKWLHLKGNGDVILFRPIASHLISCDSPAYDSDYLLDKLPTQIFLFKYSDVYKAMMPFNGEGRAETAADALCQLAIALFEAGVLVKREP